jgi:dihydrodipicolinate reductase
VKLALFGSGGKVGSVLGPALEAAGHELVELAEAEAMVDFTSPEVVVDNITLALGAVLMVRFAAEAAKHLPSAEIVEMHHETKVDAPSGTAKATAEAMGGDVPIHSVRLPGIVAHQEVLLSDTGQLLTIRHDAFSREAYVPGVLLALERLDSLPAGVTVGLEKLLS